MDRRRRGRLRRRPPGGQVRNLLQTRLAPLIHRSAADLPRERQDGESRSVPKLSEASRKVLAAQLDVVADWQLTPREVRAARRAVASEHWQRLSNHVFLASQAAPSEMQYLWAALLHGGRGAQIGGRNALVLHGWRESIKPPFDIHLAAGRSRRKNPSWVRIHHGCDPTAPAGSPTRTNANRAAIDAAQWARSDREAMFILVSALQQRLVSATRLVESLASNAHRRGLILEVIREYTGGVDSLNELDFGALCRRYGVPEPVRQVRVVDANGVCRRIDAEFTTHDGRVLRVEIEGMHHLDPDTYLVDVDRHNDMVLAGSDPFLRALTFTLRRDAAPFMRRLRDVVVGEVALTAS